MCEQGHAFTAAAERQRPMAHAAEWTHDEDAYLLKTSAAMGTVELTGFDMMFTMALGQYFAQPSARVFTMPGRPALVSHMVGTCTTRPELTHGSPALMLKRSSLLMPGFRGTPAGMMTKWAPCKAADSESGPV